MFSLIKKLFKSAPKETVQDRVDDTTKTMVGEPVISFVRCLKATPKRFKLKIHSRYEAESSGKWPEIYPWMIDKLELHTGFCSLLDKKDGSVYYAIVHRGQFYSVKGLKFSLNGWESKYICEAFRDWRKPVIIRRDRINQAYWERERLVKDIVEKQERLKLMEKFV